MLPGFARWFLISALVLGAPFLGVQYPGFAQEKKATDDKTGDEKTAAEKAADAKARGRELWARVVKAMGGAEKLKGLASLQWNAAETRMRPGGGVVERALDGRASFPDRIRMEVEVMSGGRVLRSSFSFNRDRGWIRSSNGTLTDMNADLLRQQREGLLLATTPLLRDHESVTARELEGSILDDKNYRVLELRRKGLSPVTFYIDPKSYQVARRRSMVVSQGKTVTREEMLWEYKSVDGIWLPHQRKVMEDGQVVFISSINSYKVNPKLEDSIFARPGSKP